MENSRKNKGKKEQGKFIWSVLLLVFAAGLVITLVIFGIQKYRQKRAGDYYESLAESVIDTQQTVDEVPKETEREEARQESKTIIPDKNIDFAVLKEENEDVYAWIYVPGTQVDYPILQHPSDDSYYLNHNMDGSLGLPGCIYTELVNSKDFTDPNTVLYGHNMKNGSMFASLHNFEDRQVFEENQYIYLYTPTHNYVYRIFAAYEFSAIHLIYNFDLNNEEIFQNYLDQIFEIRDMNANIRQDLEVNSQDHIITLSTCITGQKNERYLVQGVLLNDNE